MEFHCSTEVEIDQMENEKGLARDEQSLKAVIEITSFKVTSVLKY